tara:strand:+ start:869 stop:1351 length:483 start_codon:yes stop_codon:yes gene_type:complete
MKKHVKLTVNKKARIRIDKLSSNYKITLLFGKKSKVVFASTLGKCEKIANYWINNLGSNFKDVKIEFRGVIRTFYSNKPIPNNFLIKFQDDKFFDFFYTNNRYTPSELITVDTDNISLEESLALNIARNTKLSRKESLVRAKKLSKSVFDKLGINESERG